MPVPLRSTNTRAEVKYNVTTEFPNLSLHYAAATGNVGLVKFALRNGQPVNSVLDGVLPLHAACAGGSEPVVQLLLDHGADVNAPRLPRKYSSDRNRDTTTPIVGQSGATPLHFASANGHTNIVKLLLLKGAHADRTDKHGINPQMVAQQNHWVECEQVIKNWVLNKDKDLRERQFSVSSTSTHSSPDPSDSRKRVHVKHSIDHALNKLKASSGTLSDAYHRASPSHQTSPLINTSPPASPISPPEPTTKFGEYTFYPVSPSDDGGPPIDNTRRPSLPHLDVGRVGRKDSIGESKLSKVKHHRRPRSAGNDADRSSITSPSGRSRRLGTKYSFMNLFNKKGNDGLEPPSSSHLYTTSNGCMGGSTVSLLTHSHTPPPSTHPTTHPTTHPPPHPTKARHRMGSDARQVPQSPLSSPSHHGPPLAIDLHNALAQNSRTVQSRDRSVSAGSGTIFDIPSTSKPVPIPVSSNATDNANKSFESGSAGSFASISPGSHKSSSPIARLVTVREQERSNNTRDRSSSRASQDEESLAVLKSLAAESGYANSAMRALKLDTGLNTGAHSPSRLGLRNSTSASSLPRTEGPVDPLLQRIPDSAPPATGDFYVPFDEEDEDDEYIYGRPLPRDETKVHGSTRPSVRPIATIVNRERGSSFASVDSLSPLLGSELGATKSIQSDFPFSLNAPPTVVNDDSSYSLLNTTQPIRSRGDSLSSMGTTSTTDESQLLSASAMTSASGGSATITIPSLAALPERADQDESPSDKPELREGQIGIVVRSESGESSQIVVADATHSPPPLSTPQPLIGSFKERRSKTPTHLDLSRESSPVNADDVLQKAQRDIIASSSTDGDLSSIPLSAKLAAYGEALEKKQQKTNSAKQSLQPLPSTPTPPESPTSGRIVKTSSNSSRPRIPPRSPQRDLVSRQFSLVSPSAGGVRTKAKILRRPHTSQGDDGTEPSRKGLFVPPASRLGHHPRSASAAEPPALDDNNPDAPLSAIPSEGFSPLVSPTSPTDNHSSIPPDLPLEEHLHKENSTQIEIPGLEVDVDSDLDMGGAPLARISTAPRSNASFSKKEQTTARNIASAHKLTRMGFSGAELSSSHRGTSALQQSSAQQPQPAKRFGALKYFFTGSK